MKSKDRLLYIVLLVIIGACYFFYRISLHYEGEDTGIHMDKSILVYPVPVEENETTLDVEDFGKEDETTGENKAKKVHAPAWTLW